MAFRNGEITNSYKSFIEQLFYMEDENMKNMYVEILVKFKNKSELCEYTTDVLNLLVTDKDVDYICLAETGEVIYTCEEGMII